MIIAYKYTKKEAETEAKKNRRMIEKVRKRSPHMFKKTKIVVKKAGRNKYGFKWAVHSIG